MHPYLDVLQGIIQSMPQVQCTGDIWRRNDNRKRLFARIDIRVKTTGLDPVQIDSIRCPYKIKAIGDLDGL